MANPFSSTRLVYRAPEFPADSDFFFDLDGDPIASANSHMSLQTPRSKKDVEEHNKKGSENALLFVIICLPETPASTPSSREGSETNGTQATQKPKLIPIGRISMRGVDARVSQNRNSMIGLGILEAFQNKGYGTEAIEWVLKWGFQQAGLHRIEIGCMSWNTGATRLYGRMGFVPEGVKREHLWYQGAWHDLVEFAMLEHEWRATRLKAVQDAGETGLP